MIDGGEAEKTAPEIIVKDIGEIDSIGRDTYLAVPGWRAWEYPGMWDMIGDDAYVSAFETAKAKPLSVRCGEESKYVSSLASEVKATVKQLKRGPLDRGAYLLEPLSQEEVAKIDALKEVPGPVKSIDRSSHLFRSANLKTVLDSPSLPPSRLPGHRR